MIPQKNIRNFSIIAHIDHGKSTLADRLLQHTGTVADREMQEQLLDQMDLERERGITIKAQAVRLDYRAQDGQGYELNLIDTPGHVDFSYEVSRSLAACEGALLVIDAAQGVEAQTLANLYLALEHDLEIIPVINKIDLPNARPDEVKEELVEIGLDPDDAILVSAKEGWGIDDVLEAIVKRVPAPKGDLEAPLRALIFDSHFDSYKGVIAYIRLVDGVVRPGMEIRMMAGKKTFEVTDVGYFRPKGVAVPELRTGEVGFLAATVKDVRDCRVGDTITEAKRPASQPLPGYRKALPMVFAGIYPVDTADYEDLREALEKLQLNDASLAFEPETSEALGFGFRCGFLGLLHMEIIRERLEREYQLEILTTAPSVEYHVTLESGNELIVDNPADLPQPHEIAMIAEPVVLASIMTPAEYVGAVMELCQERRGTYVTMEYPTPNRVHVQYKLPLAEIMYDFFDLLKSRTRGYATLDYSLAGYQPGDMVRLDILVGGQKVDALSVIVHREKSQIRGRQLVEKLRSIIPRQMFEVPIQASIGQKVIARETVKAIRKDVLAKCYGGDISRKRKLLEKQKEGKKRMKQVGNVEIPQEAFMAVLKVDED